MNPESRKRVRQQNARRNAKKLLNDIDLKIAEENLDEIDYYHDVHEIKKDNPEAPPISFSTLCPKGVGRDTEETSDECENAQLPCCDNQRIWDAIDEAEGNCYFSSDEKYDSDEDEEKGNIFRNGLAMWATECNVPLTTLYKLLSFLREQNIDVPAKATTLLHTPQQVQVSQKSGGDYTYFGLVKGIESVFSQKSLPIVQELELSFNIDGLPIYKSSRVSLWPVQCRIANVPQSKPFIVALYSGSQKPTDLNFLIEFVTELKSVMHTGIRIKDGPRVPVKVKCFICDAPARALVKGTVQFNGHYGCDFCDVRGEYDGRMLFLDKGQPRTDATFRNKSNKKHHKTDSPFLELEIDMICQFPIDPMHCIDLGVTRRLLMIWKEGPIPLRLSSGQLAVISAYNESLRQFIPRDFNRKPRSIAEVNMWKATELRLFLLYIGPLVLRHVLPMEKYIHFLCLSVATRILYSKKYLSTQKGFAQGLMESFIEGAKALYSDKFVTYNVHCLTHLADIADMYGSLENCAAYPFENNMSTIKRIVRGPSKPLVQVARRLAEMNKCQSYKKKIPQMLPRKSECYRMKNGKFRSINKVHMQKGRVLSEVYSNLQNYFTTPCSSKNVGIYQVNTQPQYTKMEYCNIDDLESKAIFIPLCLLDQDLATSAAILSLVHSL